MSEFVTFARACGLDIVAARPSDKIQRCATIAHPRAKNGAFKSLEDLKKGMVGA